MSWHLNGVTEKSAQFRRIVVVPVRFVLDISRVNSKALLLAQIYHEGREGVAV